MKQIAPSDLTRKRYDRLAFIYDLFEYPMEWLRFASWRAALMNKVQGRQVLEVGVGTGKNLPHYPRDIKVIAIDLSPRMLEKAKKRALGLHINVELLEMDAQYLTFPDPVLGLRELRRVCKPGGKLLLLEHMRPGNPLLGFIFDILNPMVVRMTCANINRRTLDNVLKAGWRIKEEALLSSDIVKLIHA